MGKVQIHPMAAWRACVCLGFLLCLASAGRPDYAVSKGGALRVNGVEVLTLRTRSAASAAALIRNAKEGISASVRKRRRSADILFGGRVLVTVSKQEAAANGSTPAGLAGKWASNLNAALSLPPIKVLTSGLEVPLGGTRLLKVVGSKAHVAAWRVEPKGRLEIRRKDEGLEVVGRSLGGSVLVLSHEDELASAEVAVLPLAAVFPQNLTAMVSGLPAREEIVRGAIETSVRTTLKTAKGAKLKLDVPGLWTIEPGKARSVTVGVRAEAQGAFATSGQVQVLVRNVGIGYAREEELWYSNDPENLKGPGTLMHGDLGADKPVRLLYHHVNESPQGLYVKVEAANPSDEPAQLMLIPGDAEPDKNPVLAGIVAAERFMRRWLSASGEIIQIPPRSRVALALRRLAPKETMSGLCSVWLLDGGPKKLELSVRAHAPDSHAAQLAALVQTEAPWRYLPPSPFDQPSGAAPALFEHIYPNPLKVTSLNHLVGGRHGFVRIGQEPIVRQDQNGALSGNFGVIYRIEVTAENPTEIPSELELLFEASAGYSGAIFVLNGGLMRTPLIQPKSSVRLLRLRLEPGQQRKFDLYTLPLSGSSYPATVMLRPVDAGLPASLDLSDRWVNKL
jgi:hypothetical protein